MKRGPPLPVQYMALGHWIFEYQARQRFGQNVARVAARRPFCCNAKYSPFAVVSTFAGPRVDAHLAREALAAPSAGRLGRPEHQLFASGCASDQPLGAQHQAARRGVGAMHATRRDRFRRAGLEQLSQVVQRRLDHPVGDLFGADFEKKRDTRSCRHLARGGSSPLLVRPACATPTASLRTRAITPTRSVTLMAPRASSRLNRCEHFSTCS